MYNQGDIVWINFPFTGGHGVKGRPALVISNSLLNDSGYNEILMIPITSRPDLDNFSFQITNEMVERKMPKTSQARCHMVTSLHKGDIVKTINRIRPQHLDDILEKVISLIS